MIINQLLEIQNHNELADFLETNQIELIKLISTNEAACSAALNYYNLTPNKAIESAIAQILALCEIKDLEHYALNKLQFEAQDKCSKWLKILSYVGASTAPSRKTIIDMMSAITESESLNFAIQALSPSNALSNEKQAVIKHLEHYLSHRDDEVRASCIEILTFWSDNPEPYILSGLNDSSALVRNATVDLADNLGHATPDKRDELSALNH